MLEPDLGTTLCFLIILLGLLWTIGLPLRYFIGMLVTMLAAVTLLAVTEPYRLQRLTSFTDPFRDAENTGHQAVQGLYALSSGGVFGVGLGSGTSKFGWVPNANSDYVFAIVGEELGLLGCLAVLLSFGLLAFAAVRVARRSDTVFVRLAASGAAVWLCGQALINIGYVTGLLPVTGIPLPFVSAGGTSLVLTMGVLGMLVSFARHEPAAVRAARSAAAHGRAPRLSRWLCLGVPRPQAERRRPAPVRTVPVRPTTAVRPRPAPVRVRPAARTLPPTGTDGKHG
jgi:cell division protein FtsW